LGPPCPCAKAATEDKLIEVDIRIAIEVRFIGASTPV
jgi:hypothetical protein